MTGAGDLQKVKIRILGGDSQIKEQDMQKFQDILGSQQSLLNKAGGEEKVKGVIDHNDQRLKEQMNKSDEKIGGMKGETEKKVQDIKGTQESKVQDAKAASQKKLEEAKPPAPPAPPAAPTPPPAVEENKKKAEDMIKKFP